MIKIFVALLTALAGLVFTIMSALGLADAVCVTDGCRLFQDTTFLGLDLYWFGAFFFGVTAALLYRQLTRPGPALGPSWFLVLWLSAGLLVSAFLLGVQALTTVCLSCLIVAGLLGVTVLLVLAGSRLLTGILLIWALVLVTALSGLLRQQFDPVPVFGGPEAALKVFFAPSCPSCLVELRELAAREEIHPRLALYPLALRPADLAVIYHFRRELTHSGDLAAAVALLAEAGLARPGWREMLAIRTISFRNRAFLAVIGARTVPYLLTSAPSLLAPPPRPPLPAEEPGFSWPPVPAPAPNDEGCELDQLEELCEEAGPAPLFNLEMLRPAP